MVSRTEKWGKDRVEGVRWLLDQSLGSKMAAKL